MDEGLGLKAACLTCGRLRPVCCGNFTDGFWCVSCCPSPYDDDDDDEGDFYGDDDGDEDASFDCGMDIHGDCGKSGSEECDFECPYRNVKRN
jgi:hypothetical protein